MQIYVHDYDHRLSDAVFVFGGVGIPTKADHRSNANTKATFAGLLVRLICVARSAFLWSAWLTLDLRQLLR